MWNANLRRRFEDGLQPYQGGIQAPAPQNQNIQTMFRGVPARSVAFLPRAPDHLNEGGKGEFAPSPPPSMLSLLLSHFSTPSLSPFLFSFLLLLPVILHSSVLERLSWFLFVVFLCSTIHASLLIL